MGFATEGCWVLDTPVAEPAEKTFAALISLKITLYSQKLQALLLLLFQSIMIYLKISGHRRCRQY
jgi:hypothetical protein